MNAHRGESQVELAGTSYTLRPTFEALADMEQRTGEPLLSLSERVISGRLTLRDCVNLLRAGIAGGGVPVPDDLERLLVEEGYLKITAEVVQWFRVALVGDPEARSDKVSPPEAKSD